MKKFLVIFILFGIAYCLAKVTWSYNIYQEQCEAFVQVNEDSSVIFLETMHIPGTYMMTACWDSYITACHVKQDEVSYINGMKKNSTTTFLNNENQICYFQDFGLRVGNMGGFYYQPWSYVSSLNIWVSCEDSSSVPQYCAKTEKMANQVLLAREEMECKEKGGEFEGGVYRFKMPNDSIEYCVAGRCDICNSQWYKNFVEHWKDSVCCESRRKEPNTNNGTCVSPPPFDSTKIGVNHSKITAFPGCSNAKAGKNNNFCFRSSSSSVSSSSTASSSSVIFSSSWSSSSSTASSSSNGFSSSWNSSSSTVSSSSVSSSSNESSSSEYSSSSEDSSSSSEEQEPGSCYPNSSDAQQALRNAEAECWSMQKESSFKLDDNGCLTGECYGGIYSSDDGGGLSSTSEWESSSSEDEQCIDVSLKKTSDEETDQWVYVGKEKYTSRTISYEEVTPSSGFFDALGRMYKTIKSKIKYYMGLETKVKKTADISEEMEVWKRTEIYNGEKIVSYRKTNKDNTIKIDSIVFKNSLYDIIEQNLIENTYKYIDTSHVEYFAQYDDRGHATEILFIGLKNNEIYDDEGFLLPHFKKVHDDTVFFNVELLSNTNSSSAHVYTFNTQTNSKLLAKVSISCSGLNEDPTMPKAQCQRYEKADVNKEPAENIFSPGIRESPTFGFSFGELNTNFSCDYECDKSGRKLFYHSPEAPLTNEKIIIMASNWKKDEKTNKWKELCWKKENMQATYDHEAQHIRNARAEIAFLFHHFMTTSEKSDINKFQSEEECIKKGQEQMNGDINKAYTRWNAREIAHLNTKRIIGDYVIPASPQPTNRDREAISCPRK